MVLQDVTVTVWLPACSVVASTGILEDYQIFLPNMM